MAKPKPNITGLLARTENAELPPADNSDLDNGEIRPVGVGLSRGEREALDQMAAEMDIARNALLRFAIRWFIVQYRAGLINPEEHEEPPQPQKRKLRLPR